ncbi:serine protease inhibitor [Ramaria rubella]|nr:serine protease inhibitor [Ramaria rubella]
MSEKLPTDQYYIRNDDNFAGRSLHEVHSLQPKPILSPTNNHDSLWILEALPNGRYKLKAGGAPTGVMDGFLYAFLIKEERAEEWVITKREHPGHRAIENAAKDAGWIALKEGDHKYPLIAVRPLKEGRSNPPFFPPNELWNIQPLVN